MDEYIKREQAIKTIIEHPSKIAVFTAKAITAIENIPAADVVEVVHGEWVTKEEKEGAYCSICDREALIDPNFIGRDFVIEELSDWCPHCGAKMDGENSAK